MEDKRQIIRNKSVYSRKLEGWNLLDEIQYKWILLKVGTQKFSLFGRIRYNVKQRLMQNSELEGVFDAHDGKRNYLWLKS